LASQRVIDFDAILLLALRILTDRPSIADIYQRNYRHLWVDEAQDLNSVQYSLIRTLGEKADSVLLVGDPNQAIYGFNGSSHRFMMEEFPKDFQVQRIELRENYRSSRAVILAASKIGGGSALAKLSLRSPVSSFSRSFSLSRNWDPLVPFSALFRMSREGREIINSGIR